MSRRRTAPPSRPSQRALAFDPLMGVESHFDVRARSAGSAAPTTRPMSAWSGTPRRSARSTIVNTARDGGRHQRAQQHRRDLSQCDERPVRHQIQGRRRLQGGDRDQHRDGARRGRRPLRHHLGHAGSAQRRMAAATRRSACWCSSRSTRIRDLPDVPSVFDLAKTEEQRQILTVWAAPNKMGRPFFAPPGMAPERVAAAAPRLRCHHEGPRPARRGRQHEARGRPPSPASRSRPLIRQVYATPKDVVAKAALAGAGKGR